MSLPLTEWISGALSRSESARSSSAAPWQPAPHMITTLPAASIRRAISAMSAVARRRSPARGFKVATLGHCAVRLGARSHPAAASDGRRRVRHRRPRSPDGSRPAPAPARRWSRCRARRRGTADRARSSGCNRCPGTCAACRRTAPAPARGRGSLRRGRRPDGCCRARWCRRRPPSRPVSLAWPAAASAAPSSWRTPIHSMSLRRTASASGLSESPINPKICLTPICSQRADQDICNRLRHRYLPFRATFGAVCAGRRAYKRRNRLSRELAAATPARKSATTRVRRPPALMPARSCFPAAAALRRCR